MSEPYYILSLKHRPVGNCALFWGPRDAGYGCEIDKAGKYSQQQIDENPEYYDNKTSTLAVPCADVDAAVVRHVRWEKMVIMRASILGEGS